MSADDPTPPEPPSVQPAPPACADFGAVLRTFEPSRANLVAGIILGALALLAGFAMVVGIWRDLQEAGGVVPLRSDKQGDLDLPRLLVAIAIIIGLGITAVGLFVWSVSRFSLRIIVREGSVEVRDATSAHVIRWDEIKTVTETREPALPPALRWLVSNPDRWIARRSYVLRDGTGELLSFDVNTVRDHVALGTMIREATDRRGVPWKIVERRGE